MTTRNDSRQKTKKTVDDLKQSVETHKQQRQILAKKVEHVEQQIFMIEQRHMQQSGNTGNIAVGWAIEGTKNKSESDKSEKLKLLADLLSSASKMKKNFMYSASSISSPIHDVT